MKRFEIYINSKNRVTIDVFQEYEDEYIYARIKGNRVYEIMQKLVSNQLYDVVGNKIRDNISLEYKNYVVVLNEPDILLKRKGFIPFINSINKYNEEKSKKVVTNKKVTRKNKHTGKKILATGLVILVLGTIAHYIPESYTLENSTSNSLTQIGNYETDDDNLSVQFLNYEDSEASDTVSVGYEDRSSTEKAYNTKALYGELIEKYAKQYGLDPNLVLGIATQERGLHSEKQDAGGATGLMQLQNSVWENEYIQAYNYETQKMEKVYISKEKIKDVSSNIKLGCMYLQNCMEYMDYNVIAAVQCYNMGYGNTMAIINAYANNTNKSVKEVLKDVNDTGWLEYREIIKVGDQSYVENVFSWIGSDIKIENKKTNNSSVKISIDNHHEIKKIY